MAESKEEIKKKHKWKILPHSSDIPFLLMIFPALVITVIFAYFPMMGLLVAFKDYVPKLGIFNSQWASSFGFQNFIDIFETPGLVDAIWNTFFLNILSLVVNFPMPIIFALLLEEVKNRAFKAGCQTISYLPHFLSMVAVTGISLNLISEYGMINDLLHAVTGERIIFMGDENWFVPIYIIIVTWKGMGWKMQI